MKRTSKFAVAVFLLVTAVTAMPRLASAQTGTDAVASAAVKGEATDTEHKDWSKVIAPAIATLVGVIL